MPKQSFETTAIRSQMEQSAQQEHSSPLYLTSSYIFDSAEHGEALFSNQTEGNLYSRFSNPNTDELAHKMCLLEGCEAGVTSASGMAAVFTTFAALLQAGDHVVSASSIFGNSRYILEHILPNMGIQSTLVQVDDNGSFSCAIRPETKLVFVETPTNPTLKIADLDFLGELCQAHISSMQIRYSKYSQRATATNLSSFKGQELEPRSPREGCIPICYALACAYKGMRSNEGGSPKSDQDAHRCAVDGKEGRGIYN